MIFLKKGKARRLIIEIGGFLWCLAELFIFYSWGDLERTYPLLGGLHFILGLSFYDGMLTLVLLAHSSLLADITLSTEERSRCNVYSSILASIGSNSIFITQFFWNKSNLVPFRQCCFLLSIIAGIGFWITGSYLPVKFHSSVSKSQTSEENDISKEITLPWRLFWKQIKIHRNFWIFVIITLIQVFNCHLNSNFLVVFFNFFGTFLHPSLRGILLSIVAIGPHIVVVALGPFVPKYGLHFILNNLFLLKILLALGMWIIQWQTSPVLIVAFIILNKVFTESICRHGALILSDLVDEDFVLNNRKTSSSSALNGVHAFFTKPGQSLAPMLGWFVLSLYNYQNLDTTQQFSPNSGIEIPVELKNGLFNLLVFVPIACGLVQIFLWSQFTLKGDYLRQVKQIRGEKEGEEENVNSNV